MSIASETIQSSFGYEEVKGVPVVTLRESLSQFPLGKVEEAGTQLVSKLEVLRPKHLLVDLSELPFIGSALVALVVRLWKAVKERGGRTVVVVQSAEVREVLGLARLDKHWELVETLDVGCRELGLPVTGADGTKVSSGMRPGSGIVLANMSLAVLGVIGAVFGTILLATNSTLVGPLGALFITGGAAVVGLIAGTVLMLDGGAGRRTVGTLALLVCAVAIVSALILYVPAAT